MAARHTGARVRAAITYYRLKYTDADARITTLQADYLAAYEAFAAGQSDVLSQTSAGDQSAAYAVGATAEEIIDALAQTLEFFERGVAPQGWAQARIA